jgi:hypothetical protein
MFVAASFQEKFGELHPQDPAGNRHSLVSMIVSQTDNIFNWAKPVVAELIVAIQSNGSFVELNLIPLEWRRCQSQKSDGCSVVQSAKNFFSQKL